MESEGNDENNAKDRVYSSRLDNHGHDFIICAQMLSGHEAFHSASVSEKSSCHEECVYDSHADCNAEKGYLTLDVVINYSTCLGKDEYG